MAQSEDKTAKRFDTGPTDSTGVVPQGQNGQEKKDTKKSSK